MLKFIFGLLGYEVVGKDGKQVTIVKHVHVHEHKSVVEHVHRDESGKKIEARQAGATPETTDLGCWDSKSK